TAALATEALGRKNVIGIMMPSRYSSEGSLQDALMLAKNLGIQLEKISIEPIFSIYLKILEQFF
ncbi:MAG: NAD+ synthase, partial [Deltaproteobacteria bacterium]